MTKDFFFISHGLRCAAWHLTAENDALAGQTGRPCVVMAHGFGGTRDTGLLAFAEPFAAAGMDVLVFDYRGFGDSEGEPRQDISAKRQRQDYHAAIDAARNLPGIDRDRIALWGTSYSGGHVISVAAQDQRVAAVVSMNPATDGLAALTQVAREAGVATLAQLTAHGVLDAIGARLGRRPHYVRVVGQPGTTAAISTPGSEDAYLAMSGPTWRNEVAARTALDMPFNRPTVHASQLECPLLMQIGTNDHVTPADAARRAAKKAGYLAHLCEYPIDHFDFYDGEWQQHVLADQLTFLTRVLDPIRSTDVHLRSTKPPAPRLAVKLPW
ncbi:alpha/beta hydrolase [Mycobacterium sp. CBMA293]|uniref:alpha/beta hydrolase n=1 Tax=unclassified Mycolicibacterium TaxID=2636767 RepID=UPI0012DEF6CB|nr:MULTISPECIES: alpha/beta hydrolase [unclassified Mycolicibacterium]MUL47769.1 alpha/beta hydrolase [Mycolicibacterium sp. CBMA 360]MUL61713.1 alpha/beta hydrolase [Mycolicibacterium sp. CBMA 335]MUL70777.1 alpha/beta hydrolase [Mycolicibacterium sp. CBMA 311]MUL97359.1 alpha/beta hydrolase [Mycolicibacterium sp. CBMA 230]MUM08562.1 alpha/beta hydrolase [Mycolicibacterium sp. CBMA 213]